MMRRLSRAHAGVAFALVPFATASAVGCMDSSEGSSVATDATDATAAADVADVPDPCVAPLSAGLLLHYDFEHDLADQSGHGRGGTIEGETSYGYVSSPTGFGLALAGGTALQVTDGGSLGPTVDRSRTVTFWADFGDAGEDVAISQYRNGEPAQSSLLVLYSHAQGYFEIAGSGVDALQFPAPDLMGWHHWMVTFSTAPEASRIYLDGVQVASGPISLAVAESPYGATVGQLPGVDGNSLDGSLDELRVYDHALTPDDLAMLATCSGVATEIR